MSNTSKKARTRARFKSVAEDWHATITLPWLSVAPPFLIDQGSPLYLRKIAARVARYFRRETGYNCEGHVLEDRRPENEARVHLLRVDEPGIVRIGRRSTAFSGGVRIVGAADFYPMRGDAGLEGWRFRWVWIHPFWRGKGVLEAAWPKFSSAFGEKMVLDQPISKPMQRFLEKQQLS